MQAGLKFPACSPFSTFIILSCATDSMNELHPNKIMRLWLDAEGKRVVFQDASLKNIAERDQQKCNLRWKIFKRQNSE